MNKTQTSIWYNGSMRPWKEAQTHVMSHSLHYGTSVFEGIRIYETEHGPAGFRLKEHVARLFDSAKIYRLKFHFDHQQILDGCCKTVLQNGLKNAYVRPVIFLGDIGLGINPPLESLCNVAIAAFEWGSYLGSDSLEQGVDACVSSWSRLAPNTMPTGAKAGGNYLSSLLITSEAQRNGFHEGIGLDINGYVSEGAGANLFVVRKGVIHTPSLTSSILPGLTRDTVIKLAQQLGYEVREENIARESLYLADEIFMTGTAAEIVPVRSVDRVEIGSGQRGAVTDSIQRAFFGLFTGETPDNYEWLDHLEPETNTQPLAG